MDYCAVYRDMVLDFAEDVEQYKLGGFHPLMINQLVGDGRFEIVHKLGSGGIATVWLARDLHFSLQASTIGPLVCLKVFRADH
jgi:serine/threonine-protein kinase SRPK3